MRGDNRSRIVVVGAGVVGTATGRGFAHKGHEVVFFDIDPVRTAALRSEGHTALAELFLPGPESFIFLTLPTPSRERGYDLASFVSGVKTVGAALRDATAAHTIVVRSTVPPGTCEGLVQPLLEELSGKRAGRDFQLASAPEFLRAASALDDFLSPWMTVLACRDRRTLERLEELFEPLGGEQRSFDDPAAAEMIKCSHNLYNATKISFWNEMWRVCKRLGLDSDAIAATVARSAEGSFNPLYGIRGGAPYGGDCLPKDVAGFLGLADRCGVSVPLIEGVAEVNAVMSELVASEMATTPPVIDPAEDGTSPAVTL